MENQHTTCSSQLDLAALLQQLTDSDQCVRRRAALTLGQLKARGAVGALIATLQDYATVWDAAGDAAWALGEIGDVQAVEPLIWALEYPYVAGRAIEALAKLNDRRAVEPLIRFLQRTGNPSVATVLGNFGDRRAVEPLIASLRHPNPSLRFYVARALGKLGDKRALPALEWAQTHDKEPIFDRKSTRGKSVSDVAAKAIARIKAQAQS